MLNNESEKWPVRHEWHSQDVLLSIDGWQSARHAKDRMNEIHDILEEGTLKNVYV